MYCVETAFLGAFGFLLKSPPTFVRYAGHNSRTDKTVLTEFNIEQFYEKSAHSFFQLPFWILQF
jgi:hypothetical protein